MITGSGQQDRDETIFRHHPFAVIADYLTRRGYAVLRVDDRQKGMSTGDVKNATTADFANDVQASFDYLQTRPEVDHKKIGLIGHSEGGIIAAMVASRNPQVSFLISMAGPGISGAEILLAQQTDPVKGLVSDSSFNAYHYLTQKTLQLIHDNPQLSDSALQQKIEDLFSDWKGSLSFNVLQPIHADGATPQQYAQQIKPELSPWMRFFITTEPTDYWIKVKCPVLAIDGEKDIQVNANENIPIIERALELSGDPNVTTKIFPGLNHLFQLCSKCTVPEYNEIKQTISPEVLTTIGDWLDKNIHKTTP
jgi:pimeloyl-ACP methyl ester carboxylesterase